MNTKDKKEKRQEIVNRLNQPNFIEREQMKREGLTWEQLRVKLKVPVYK